jgi:hypothetical protein
MVVGKTVLFALPGLTALTLSGKLNWNDPKQVEKAITDQFLDPSIALGFNGPATKTNPDGVPQSLHLPTTFVSEIGKIIKPALDPMSTYDGNRLSGLESYATNRVAALPGTAARLVQNKDFYGNPIITDNPTDSALNVTGQIAPIPVVQGIKQGSGQQNLETSILNTLGGRVSGDSSSPEAAHTAGINEYYNTLNPVRDQKSAMIKKINTLATTGHPNQASRLAQQWNDSLPGKFSALRAKYPNYSPKDDSNYTSLHISPKDSAIAKRNADSQKALKVLKTFQ